MKKSLIALAVAGAMTAPMVAQADATLYGSFRMGIAQQDNKDLDLRDESTRIGIKGDVDLGLENTKGLFHWEGQLMTDSADLKGGSEVLLNRLAYMGATGSWGTALAGQQYHPYYTMVNSHTNVFNSADGEFGEAFALGNSNHKRVANTIAYASPVMGGFQAVAGIVVAGGNDDTTVKQEDVDGYNIGVEYTGVENLRVSASYGDVDNGRDFESNIWGLGATYGFGDLTLSAKYEDREDSYSGFAPSAAVVGDLNTALAPSTVSAGPWTGDIEFTVWELAAQYQIGATALKARYGNIEANVDGIKGDGDQWGIEVEHKLGQRGRVWVGYTDLDEEAAFGSSLASSSASSTSGLKNISEDTFVVGYRLDF